MNQEAQKYLVQRLMIAVDRPPGIEVLQWRQQMLAGFGGAIEALRAANAMDADEVQRWMNRMHEALGLTPVEPIPPGFQGGQAMFIGEGEPPAPPPPFPVAQFLDLIPVDGADGSVPYGGRVQILGIERYDTKVAVAWRLAPLPDPEAPYAAELHAHDQDTEGLPERDRMMLRRQFLHHLNPHLAQQLTLSDDLGTEYRHTGGGSGGGMEERIGRAELRPAIPEDASELTVHWDDLAFLISLS